MKTKHYEDKNFKEIGNGKWLYKSTGKYYWYCPNCNKEYKTKKGYLNHLFNQRCKK